MTQQINNYGTVGTQVFLDSAKGFSLDKLDYVKPKQRRTLVIGDIHGGLKSLKQALDRSGYSPDKDKLIFLGDYVDGWSETAELIEYLISIQKISKFPPVFIMGNHDAWCKDWLMMGQCPLIWQQQGGQATIDSYIRTGYLVSEEHRKFFKDLVMYYIDEENRGFVHGGFISKNGLGHEHYQSDYYWDRDLWNLALLQHNNYHEGSKEAITKARRFEKHKEVFIGHTTTGNWLIKPHLPEYQYPEQAKQGRITTPMNRCNVWNLDTGGGYEGKLTIMDVESKEFWQSDFVNTLYADERGRN
jgi:serine/threonine protein phosphatase 1